MYKINDECFVSVKNEKDFKVLLLTLENDNQMYKLTGIPALLTALASKGITLSSDELNIINHKFDHAINELNFYTQELLTNGFLHKDDSLSSEGNLDDLLETLAKNYDSKTKSEIQIVELEEIESDVIEAYAGSIE